MTIEIREPSNDSEFVVPADNPQSNHPVDRHQQDRSEQKPKEESAKNSDENLENETSETGEGGVKTQETQEGAELSEEDKKAAKAAAKEAFRRRKAEREAQASAERIKSLEDQIKELSTSRNPAERKAVAEAPKRPNPKDFELGRWDPKYEDALNEWMDAREQHILSQAEAKASEATSKYTQEAESIREQSRFVSLADQVEERGIDKYEDFVDIVQDALEAMPPHPEATKHLVQLPNAEDVFYHLAQKPDELERITGLDPMGQALEFGKISARLAASAKVAKTATKSQPTPKMPRGDDGKFESESDARYAKMLKATESW